MADIAFVVVIHSCLHIQEVLIAVTYLMQGRKKATSHIPQGCVDDNHTDNKHLGNSHTAEVVFSFTFVNDTLVTP